MFFLFNDASTTETYTLSLHDALPISGRDVGRAARVARPLRGARARRDVDPGHDGHDGGGAGAPGADAREPDRKSTRLNSSHANISYAVFCLKKITLQL